jgi:proteasome lid subunit RPN8/RPN11
VLSVRIAAHVLSGMIAHARDDAPNECCGLLAGTADHVDEQIRTTNLRGSAVAYQVDPAEHIAIRKSLRQRGRRVRGAYHSHPRTPALPSATDVAEAYYGDDFLYVIVSLAGEPDIRAYQRRDGTLVAVPVETA